MTRYSPNHPTMRGRDIPPTLAQRRAAVRSRLGYGQPRDHYKLRAWLGFVGFVAAAGIVEHSPIAALCLAPVVVLLWLPFDREYWGD